jgi:Flp pilus assembly protein TadB
MLTTLLLTVVFMLGIFLLIREVFRRTIFKAEEEQRAKLREMMQRATPEEWAAEQGGGEKKSRRQKLSDDSPLLDGVTNWLQGSSLFHNREGRDFLGWLDRQLTLAGLQRKYTPYQAMALVLTIWTIGFIAPTAMVLFGLPKILYILMVVVALIFPPLQLRSLKKQRAGELRAEVPWMIHELSMALATEALTLQEALARITRALDPDAVRTPLRQEFAQAVIEVRGGAREWEQALLDVVERTEVLEVETFVDTLISASRTGADIVKVLDQYAQAATEGWSQDTLAFINKQEPRFMLGMVLIIFGIMAWFSGPIVIGAFSSLSGG